MSSQKSSQPESMVDFFDQRANSYDQHMQENVENFEGFYHAIALSIPHTSDPIKILDIGCGTGLELALIFQRAPKAQITGIDLSEKMLTHLRYKYTHRLTQIKLIQGSYLEVDLGIKQYEYAISVMTLHHLLPEKKLRLYEKIHRALKEGGQYIEGDYVVSEEKESQVLAAYREWIRKVTNSEDGAYHIDIPMTKQRQVDLLKKAGFADVETCWEKNESAIFVANV